VKKVLINFFGVFLLLFLVAISVHIIFFKTPEVNIGIPESAIFDLEEDGHWYPGKRVEKKVEIENAGNVPVKVSFFAVQKESSPLRVSFQLPEKDGRKIDPGENKEVLVRAYMPAETGNAFQGERWKKDFIFRANKQGVFKEQDLLKRRW